MKRLIIFDIMWIVVTSVAYLHKVKQLNDVKLDLERIESEYFNANQVIDSIRNKNNELRYTIDTLSFMKSKLEKSNADLIEVIKKTKH